MIDFIILEQTTPFAVIMQKHGGWVGWMQSVVLSSLGCIHFNRSESKDRALVAQKCALNAFLSPAAPAALCGALAWRTFP